MKRGWEVPPSAHPFTKNLGENHPTAMTEPPSSASSRDPLLAFPKGGVVTPGFITVTARNFPKLMFSH